MNTAPRWQKVFSDLWGSRARSLLVIASITVGLFAIGIITTLYAVIAQDMRAGYRAVNAANIYVQAAPFDRDLVESLRHVEGVRQAEGVRAVDLRVRNGKGEWESIRLQAVEDWAEMPINRLTLKQGVWPPGRGQIVVDQYKLPGLKTPLGGTVTLEMQDGTTRTLNLTGVVQDLTVGAYSGGGGFFNAPVMGYITQETLEDLGQSDPYLFNGAYLTLTGDGDNLDTIRATASRVTQALEDAGTSVLSSKSISSIDHPNAYLVDAIVGVLFVLGLLVVFLSGFLITSTLQSLLAQQTLQIGIMKSVGARRIQVAGIYMMLILMLGLIAFVIAAPLSNILSFLLLRLLARQLNFVMLGDRVVLPALLLQAGLALIMPQLAAGLPIWKGTSISVKQALAGSGEGSEKTSRTLHRKPSSIGALAKRLFSRPMLIAFRNTFRRRGRLALTLVTLTLGGAIFIATFNVQVSMGKYIDQISQYFLADVSVTFDQPYRINKIEGILAQVPGVGHVEGWATARSEILESDGTSGDRVSLLAPPAGSQLVRPVMVEGRWIEPGDRGAIVLGELFRSRYPNLRVGDPIHLRVNGEDTTWTVVGFFRFAGKNGGYSAYTSFDYLSELTGLSNRAVQYQVMGSHPGLTPAQQDQLAQAIQQRLKDEGIRVSNVTTGSFLSGIAGSGFGVLTAFLLFMAVLTALVGSIGLTGTMSMNVMERTREIGVMRAIGASDRMLMRMVLVEGLVIGAISYLLGALLAFPISKLMSDGISLAIFDAPSSFGFTLTGFAIWLGVVVVLSFAASVLPARSASRLTIREVLAYE